MDSSVFPEKAKKPEREDLKKVLGKNFDLWDEIIKLVFNSHKDAFEEWNFSKLGWSCRIKDKKRAIIYLMPYEKYFMSSFVFGEKAVQDALKSKIADDLKDTIKSAKVYAEGRGFRIVVKNKKTADDMKELVRIKLNH